jgi:hypothetical protein
MSKDKEAACIERPKGKNPQELPIRYSGSQEENRRPAGSTATKRLTKRLVQGSFWGSLYPSMILD